MGVSLIQYKGHEILYTDYSKCTNTKEALAVLYDLEDYFRKSKGNIRNLSNFTNTIPSMRFINEGKRLKVDVFDEKLLKGTAIGIIGLQELLLVEYNKISKNKMIHFDSKGNALEYLIS